MSTREELTDKWMSIMEGSARTAKDGDNSAVATSLEEFPWEDKVSEIYISRSICNIKDNSLIHDLLWYPLTGHTDVMVQVNGSNELPTLVQGELAWGDGAPLTHLDLRSLTPPLAKGVVVQNASHYYSWHGTFHLTLRLLNPVSRINITREVSNTVFPTSWLSTSARKHAQ